MKIKEKILAGIIAGIAVLSGVYSSTLMNTYAVACPKGALRTTANTLEECNMASAHENDNLMQTANSLINVVLGVLGFVCVVVIILGAVQFLTSAGDPGKVKKAKDTILYGVIGLVIAILAYAIVNFVLSSMSGASSQSNPQTTYVELMMIA